MASGIQISCQHGPGMEPPPPHGSTSIKGYVSYKGGWNPAWEFDDESAMPVVRLGSPDMPNGVYEFHVHGVHDGVLSLPAVKVYDHTTGSASINPVFGDAPPAGDESVATPTDLVVEEAP